MLTNKQKVAKYKCETDFLFFVRYFFKKRFGYKFVVNSHHQLIADTLTRVADGKITRLVINMPPRYGKTEMAVICFIGSQICFNNAYSILGDAADRIHAGGAVKSLVTFFTGNIGP